MQHERWRFHRARQVLGIDPATAAAHDDVAAFYRELDAYLGRLRARLSPDTVLVVVSDHGHSPTIFHSMDTQHRHGPPGILLLHGGPVAPRASHPPRPSACSTSPYPTLRYLLGIAVPTTPTAGAACSSPRSTPRSSAAHPADDGEQLGRHPAARAAPRRPTPSAGARSLEKLYSLGYIR